jgi:hypothetical protein
VGWAVYGNRNEYLEWSNLLVEDNPDDEALT